MKMKTQNKLSAMNDVVSDPDLISLILIGNVGPTTFATASLVSKAWRSVCMTDERIVRSVAWYQGGLTKGAFTKLFAVPSSGADNLPHARHTGAMQAGSTSSTTRQRSMQS